MPDDLREAISRILSPETPAMEALASCGALIENELFTAMRFYPDVMEVERIHTSLPKVYPLAGRKKKRGSEWGDKVLREGRLNSGHGADHIRWAFGDHETILGLGLVSVVNAPVFRGEDVVGTINFLRGGDAFTARELSVARLLAAALGARGDYGTAA